MKKLKLPKITDFPDQKRWLSMDEYVRFVNFTAAHLHKKRNAKKSALDMAVTVPFSLE